MPRNVTPKDAMKKKVSYAEPGKTAVYSHRGRMFPQNVILVGARGSGKTTLGMRVAGLLGKAFVDTDMVVEAEAGKPIADIVAEGGWEAFRALEAEAVVRLCGDENRFIATGGGAVLDEASRKAMKDGGLVFYLKADADTLLARLAADPGHDQRPALTDKAPGDEMRDVLAERGPLYEEVADHVLDAVATPQELTVRMLDALRAWATEQQ